MDAAKHFYIIRMDLRKEQRDGTNHNIKIVMNLYVVKLNANVGVCTL